ncbi:MAG: transcriptional regulator, partial [Clostridium sp.]|nr:transcriptional regulator [Clostridium sp.]
MDKDLFRKTEGKLYRYYQSKKKIRELNNEISNLEYHRERVEYDIRHANVTIDYYQNGTGLQERVQSSPSGSSYAETEMCKEIEKL